MAQFSSESLLSNAADQLPTLPKTQSAYAARNRYSVLDFIYYDYFFYFFGVFFYENSSNLVPRLKKIEN